MSWERLQALYRGNSALRWPYPIRYDVENSVEVDVLVIGGGIAGCWAAISAARKGARVAIVEKGSVLGSGAGTGCDHWQWSITGVPGVEITAEEFTQALIDNHGGYCNGISRYIQAREGYETLLDLEQMGGKVRDTEDVFKGAQFRDERTKLLFAYDYVNKIVLRVWGTTFKPALVKELKRLKVEMFERVMGTGLLTEKNEQGTRVIGATGVNVRTGEFYVFRSNATIIASARPQRIWTFSTELAGSADLRTPGSIGGGYAMAWKAGAQFAMMEKSIQQGITIHPSTAHGSGHPSNTWYPCTIVDATGKEIPWVDRDGKILKSFEERTRPLPGQKFFIKGGGQSSLPHQGLREYMGPRLANVDAMLEKGEVTLPLYADLPGLPEQERRAIFGLMVGQEAKTKLTYINYTRAGFDPDKDMLMSYQQLIGGGGYGTSATGAKFVAGFPYIRNAHSGISGGPVVNWDLMTTVEGLYAAGDGILGGNDHSHAAATGRYAGRKAASYALQAPRAELDQREITEERKRVYRPLERRDGVHWKELLAGINKTMQAYCGHVKSENLLKMGLGFFDDLKDVVDSELFATNPHDLGNALGVVDVLTTASEIIIPACLARKASSLFLHFQRAEYPDLDPPEWNRFITLWQEDGTIKEGELPIDFGSPFEDNYLAHSDP
ncbi:MAG: FAD-binding protein [Deltaproteobacteria bacterium]|nr:FAD-binding protein [Deltaproteobacteria bacterium]MBW2138492.1 FAD-binding protein [Deltaproteobacteria bacterium]